MENGKRRKEKREPELKKWYSNSPQQMAAQPWLILSVYWYPKAKEETVTLATTIY